jgi:hypothetical protein
VRKGFLQTVREKTEEHIQTIAMIVSMVVPETT